MHDDTYSPPKDPDEDSDAYIPQGEDSDATPDDPNQELYGESGEMIAKITKAVRAADAKLVDTGGSSRHWVRECFLSALEEEGLRIVPLEEKA